MSGNGKETQPSDTQQPQPQPQPTSQPKSEFVRIFSGSHRARTTNRERSRPLEKPLPQLQPNRTPTPQPEQKQPEDPNVAKLSDKRKRLVKLKTQLELGPVPVPPLVTQALEDPPSKSLQDRLDDCDRALEAEGDLLDFLAAMRKAVEEKNKAASSRMGGHPAMQKLIKDFSGVVISAGEGLQTAKTHSEVTQHKDALQVAVTRFGNEHPNLLKVLNEADAKLLEAQKQVAKYQGFGGLPELKQLAETALGARRDFAKAEDEQSVADCLKKIEGWKDKLDSCLQNKGQPIKHLEKYLEARQALQIEIGKASVLRGGTEVGSDVFLLVEAARQSISKADGLMNEYQGETTLKGALEELAKHKELLTNAKKENEKLKQRSKVDQEALPRYNDAFQALLQARNEIAALPGAAQLLGEAAALIQDNQIGPGGQPPKGGYKAALDRLPELTRQLLEKARETSRSFLEQRLKDTPGLEEARTKAMSQLDSYAELHGEGLVAEQRRALAEALVGQSPLEKVQELDRQLGEAVQHQQELKLLYEAERNNAAELLKQLDGLQVPSAVLHELRDTAPMDRMVQVHDYAEALDFAKRIQKAGAGWKQEVENLSQRWKQLEAELTQALQAEVPDWNGWPPLRQTTTYLGSQWNLLKSKLAKDNDLQSAINWAEKLSERLEEGRKQAQTLNLDDKEGFAPLTEAVKEALKAFGEAAERVQGTLEDLSTALKLQGVGDSAAGKTDWHQQMLGLRQSWLKRLTELTVTQGQTPQQAVAALLEEYRKKLEVIDEGAKKAQADKLQLRDLAESVKEQTAKDRRRALYDEVQGMLKRMTAMGLDTDLLTKRLGEYTESKFLGREAIWERIKQEAGPLLEQRTREVQELAAKKKETAKRIQSMLYSFFDKDQRRAEAFYDGLRDRADDAIEMLESEDPDLMLIGLQELDKLERVVLEAKGKDGDKEKDQKLKTFNDVFRLVKELSPRVGHKDLREQLPGTYFRLYKQWQQATQKAQSLPPQEGWLEVEAMRLPIMEAHEELQRHKERYSLFKTRSEQLAQKLKDLQAQTKLSDATKAYGKKFAAGLERAKAVAGQEGQMDAALEALNELDRELDEIGSDPANAHKLLLQKNAEAAGEQRELRDMAREWVATQKYWSDILLPRVKEALEKQGLKDSGDYQNLKGAVKAAGSPLKGYLEATGVLAGIQSVSPDMKMARQAFAGAYQRLQGLQRTADRLISGDGTTNVELQQDLAKLNQEWQQRVNAATQALKSLAQAIAALPKEVSDSPNDQAYLPPGDGGDSVRAKFGQAAQQVAKALEESHTRFGANAFASALSTLGSPGAEEADRLRAREEVLRTMRHLRATIVDSNLLRKLVAGTEQGLMPVDVRAPLGLMHATLRKIELAALVAI